MSTPIQPLTDFLPYVRPFIAGCPDPVIEFNLRLAAIEFCERTRCWRYITSATLTEETRFLSAPAYSTVHEVEQATWEGRILTPIAFTEAEHSAMTGITKESNPAYITQTEPGRLTILPFAEGTVRISAFLKPQHGSQYGLDPMNPLHDPLNVVPQFMLTQHAEAIAYGALTRLYAIPGEPWSDPNMAGAYRSMFEQRIGQHMGANIRGQQRTPIRTKPQWM